MAQSTALMVSLFAGAVYLIGYSVSDLPIVHLDSTDGSCIKVETKDPRLSCAQLPDKYTIVWEKR